MPRYRLKFLLQEFDLPRGEILIGRAPDCHVTIEDPLISRHHAKIVVSDERACVADLQSRNGSRLNGERLRAEAVLKDGDRIRLGAQELLFYQVTEAGRKARPTGFMAVCRACDTPYPQGAADCPHCGTPTGDDTRGRCQRCGQVTEAHETKCGQCGARIEREDDTISGITLEPRSNWTLQLLTEVIDKALALGRLPEAERVMNRAARELDERLESKAGVEIKHVAALCDYAMRVAEAGGGPRWAAWTLSVFRRLDRVPPPLLAARIASFARSGGDAIAIEVDRFLEDTRRKGGTLTTEEVESLTTLQAAARR
ncbi:MAG: FHA domain-containing protein [Deltaproteobacteria bacterium]|nr:FHA domain-containing protein [Deltaproteobacteria bacterium]